MSQVDIHALAGAYALDAVNDIERAGFARHLAECDTCALEVAELRETSSRLADPAWETPPPSLKSNVLAEITRTRQVGPARETRPAAAPAPARWRRWAAGAAAAVVLAAGATTTTYLLQERRVRDAARIEAVLGAPDAVVRKAMVAGGGEMSVVVSKERNESIVMLSGMAEPGQAQGYQFWFLTADKRAESAGFLDGGQTSGLRLLSGYAASDALGVTRERAGGVDQPSMQPLASLPLS